MNSLSPKELDLLERIESKEELRPLFFKKVKGLKWFDSLSERGYFNPEKNPKPKPSKEEGYVHIHSWRVVDYLKKTAPELADETESEYAEKFLRVLVETTIYAKDNKFSNYQTWWQFAEIISHIPHDLITLDTLDIVDYWLEDKYESNLVAQVVGEKWLYTLLQTNDSHAIQLSQKLIEILYKIKFIKKRYGDRDRLEASLRYDSHYAEKITKLIAKLAGEKIGIEIIKLFDTYLKDILEQLAIDSWSSIWQPAIEEHEQNSSKDDAENILIHAYRDSLNAYIRTYSDEASEYVESMLQSDYQTIQRLAIYVITKNYHFLVDVVEQLIEEKYLHSCFQHEMWHFLNQNYQRLATPQKNNIIELIQDIKKNDDKGDHNTATSSYYKAVWLSAIKDFGDTEKQLYEENTEIAKTEPEHPDFSFYMTSGWGDEKTPIPLEDLQILPIDELITKLSDYNNQGLKGLVKTFKQLIKTEPLNFYLSLDKFTSLDLAYIYEVIEAYKELWTEKAKLPWDEVWLRLLTFCSEVIKQDQIWKSENTKTRESFVANRYWIVGSIGRLIEAGTKSDDHAFSEKYLKDAEEILAHILDKEHGEEYKEDSDAVSKSINSPRGQCIEALINLTLRSCRIIDRENNKDHSEAWTNFQHYYDSELEISDSENPEYEFVTLVANYLPNFIYMSKPWVLENLSRIFDQRNYLKWLCAMQGYAYVGTIYQEVYVHLKENGDLLKVLDDEKIKDRVEEKAVHNIAVAYLNDFESFEDNQSLINVLILRNDLEELQHLIWFMWTFRKKADDKLKNKIFELWTRILEQIDFSTRQGKKIASELCDWSVFIDEIDDDKRPLLIAVAPYSHESHNSYELLESLSNISAKQPLEAHEIWMKILEGSTPDYPEESVRNIFANLLNLGPEGLRLAREVESEYIKSGNDRPSSWLREIRNEIQNT